jgi:hypothetical protein
MSRAVEDRVNRKNKPFFSISHKVSWICMILFTKIALKGMSSEIFRALFWHVWIDLGLYKNLWLFLIFSVEPLILYLCLKFKPS